MKIEFIKHISCPLLTVEEQKQNKITRGLKCSMSFNDKLENLYPQLQRGINYHTRINHDQNNHKVTLFIYDHNSKHESEHKGKIILTHNESVKKYTGTTIKEDKIKKLI